MKGELVIIQTECVRTDSGIYPIEYDEELGEHYILHYLKRIYITDVIEGQVVLECLV